MGNPAFGFAADWIVRVGGLELGDQTSRQRSRLERSPPWLHELASFVQFLYQNPYMTRFQVSDVQLALEQKAHVQKNSLPIGACSSAVPNRSVRIMTSRFAY
jgi:hypothetical protein